ncbi:membrane protein [Tumebacillus flagellatus]|uniref:Membrane protein n=1 Tax=Tumebacillus flagellatus TaxID=1157490 RepID=A0A074LMA5_9BACL|nr:membrane protein [Tumebacillus flagellatus]
MLLLRVVLFYFVILASMRLMGKREIGQLSVFDLVVSVMIAEVAAMTLESEKMPIMRGVVIVALLVVLQISMSWLTLKSVTLRSIVEGKPTLLIANGKIRDDEMRRTRYSLSDLMTQLREKDIATVSDVEFAILETTGKLSVFPKAEKRPVTPEDLGLTVPRTGLPLPLIVDGTVMDGNLEKIGQTRFWLKNELQKYGHSEFRKIFYCSIDNQGSLFIDPKE